MSKKYKLRSYDNKMISSYQRMVDGIFVDENFIHYSKDFFIEVLKYLEDNELYEKCEILNRVINKRFDHESNYRVDSFSF